MVRSHHSILCLLIMTCWSGKTLMVAAVHFPAEVELLLIVKANDRSAALFRTGECREKESR